MMRRLNTATEFVVTGFGLFFVFSVKQAPDLKIRNFRKSIAKPAVIVNKRLSSLSGRTSNTVCMDAAPVQPTLTIAASALSRKKRGLCYHIVGLLRSLPVACIA